MFAQLRLRPQATVASNQGFHQLVPLRYSQTHKESQVSDHLDVILILLLWEVVRPSARGGVTLGGAISEQKFVNCSHA